MTVNYHVLDAGRLLRRQEKRPILETIKSAVYTAEGFLGEQDIDVVIKSMKGSCSQDLQINGYAPDAHTTHITLDPNHTHSTDADWRKLLSQTIAHELHHNKRWGTVGYGKTLGEALVSEGLAQVFELETGHDISGYSSNLTIDELVEVSERGRSHISNNENYIHPHWFYGTEQIPDASEQFKRWSGYSLGFAIVSQWVRTNNTTASLAVGIPAGKILEAWLEKGPECLDFPEKHSSRPMNKVAAIGIKPQR